MYEIDQLKGTNWEFVYESENIKDIDKIAFKLTQLDIPCRILADNILLIFLNGTRYQYDYWKNNYVRKPKTLERKIKR
jgi:hypothetical protein